MDIIVPNPDEADKIGIIEHILAMLNSRYVVRLDTSPAMALMGFEPFSRHQGVHLVAELGNEAA